VILAVLFLALVLTGGAKKKAAPRSGGGGLVLVLLVAGLAFGASRPAGPATSGVAAVAPDGGPAGTAGLAPEMLSAVNALDAAMGGDLVITSGYRSAADQARVCASTSLPCAPPGRSLHQRGLAIDAANWEEAAAVLAAHPEIPLCRPFPQRDPVHFSHVNGSEC
jgi:hypothetical protein